MLKKLNKEKLGEIWKKIKVFVYTVFQLKQRKWFLKPVILFLSVTAA